MQSFKGLILLAILPALAIAQTPNIKSSSPAKFFTQSEPTVIQITLNGDNMWPDYMSTTLAGQIMHVHFNKNGRDEEMHRILISSSTQTLEFASTGWLDAPGSIEAYIIIDGYTGRPTVRSNSVFIQVLEVPKTAPVIVNISGSSFKLGEVRDKYYFRIYGKNFGERKTTYPMVNNIPSAIGWSNLEDGVMDVWIPKEVYATAGEYPVVVHTKFGESNPVTLKIERQMLLRAARAGAIKSPAPASTAVSQTSVSSVSRKALVTRADPRVNVVLLNGISVEMVGVISDGGTGATLENFVKELAGVTVVENHLSVSDSPGNININVRGEGVDASALESVRTQIRAKAAEMNLNVAVN